MSDLLTPTAFHTTGPFFPPDFLRPGDNDLTWLDDPSRRARGEVLVIAGRITEQGGAPRTNAVVELWQADAGGHFAHPLDAEPGAADPDFAGWGRTATDAEGRFHFVTVRPGAFIDPLSGGVRAPHLNLQILSSGLMRRLVTAFWFPDEAANGEDMVLSAVPPDRRGLLIAAPAPESNLGPAGATCYRLEIALQGVAETPFFAD